MNKRRFWLLIAVVSLLMILVFLVAGCRGEVTLEGTAKKEVEGKEEPDKELFDRYFSDIGLGGFGFFRGDLQKNISTFLPHQKICLYGGYESKKGFTYRIVIFDLKANDFVNRSDSVIQSEGDGWSAASRPFSFSGSYEYRVYVEDTLVAVLPFEVISYFDYFRF